MYYQLLILLSVNFISVCKALESGVAGLFGPQSGPTASHIQSICDTLEIPHIETRWVYSMEREDYSVNLYPHPQALGQVRKHMES
jgi:ionotropic glutamate receptor